MKLSKILSENKVEDFRSKFSHKFGEFTSQIEKQVLPKYLDWVGRNLESINFPENFQKLLRLLKIFESYHTNFAKTDIEEYKSIKELSDEVDKYLNKKRGNIQETEGGNVVYSDDRFYVVNPLTHKSSCYYGKGTKWCTSSEISYWWDKKNVDSKIFYIIDKGQPIYHKFYKVSLIKSFTGQEEWIDANSQKITSGWIFDTEEFKKIQEAINNYFEVEFEEQIEIFKDEELADKERKRQEKLRIARENQRKEDEAQERRENGEWDLNDDCPDEGLKAHALLKYLEEQGEDVLTYEDQIEKTRIELEVSDLEDLEQTDEVTEKLEQLEEELEEYKNKIDVYSIYPVGEHYKMTRFEILNDNFYNQEYSVGDEDEMQQSAVESLENYIDEMGLENAFSRDFLESHIDSEKVEDRATSDYEDDVNYYPESYFDDSERMLSSDQEENIQSIELRIEQLENTISKLESYRDESEDDDEDYDTQIDEINDKIQEFNDKIEEIKENPEGEFPDDIINEKIQSLVDEATSDPEYYIRDRGLDLEDFIDTDELIQDVIDSDGYGSALHSYDGSHDEVRINNQLYYIIRNN